MRIGLLNRKAGLTVDQFRSHWISVHGALVSKLPRLRRYEQNHVIHAPQGGSGFKSGGDRVDGFSELHFDHDDDMREALATQAAKSMVENEVNFLAQVRVVTVERIEVVPPPTTGPFNKRISLVRRRSDISHGDFVREWQGIHAQLIRSIPGVIGYRQNVIVGRQSPKGREVDYDGLPIDGVVELWFPNPDAPATAFASPEGKEALVHTSTIAGAITTFPVEPLLIV
ncbi:EthD domain-containing protein [Trinickia symbiotica]|uniref:EthD domain-containing protein n=1 Tax=Trinickia symbiotica TaxID=863227 RepID=UPI001CB97596|nr:EthD family reductase [Trinickia symbiotica]